MRRLIVIIFSGLALIALLSCAQSPGTSQSVFALPPPPSGYGRVFVYRLADVVGAWQQPNVMMNGRTIGSAVPGQYFFINLPPGSYTVSTVSDPGSPVTFSIGPGALVYIRLNSVFAGIQQVFPELVGESEGLTQMQGLSYRG
jgi:hypothetical protein